MKKGIIVALFTTLFIGAVVWGQGYTPPAVRVPGDAGQLLTSCGNGKLCASSIYDIDGAISTAAHPASPANSVQFNNGGAFGGSSNLTYVENKNDGLCDGVVCNLLKISDSSSCDGGDCISLIQSSYFYGTYQTSDNMQIGSFSDFTKQVYRALADGGYDPYDGAAAAKYATSAGGASVFQFQPGITDAGGYSEGKIFYDDEWKTLSLYGGASSDIKLQVGQETVAYVYNGTGSPIGQGKVVYISGAYGALGYPSIALADNTAEATSFALGVVTTTSISAGGYGFVTIRGHVHDLNTNAFSVGDSLYLGTSGDLTNVAPSAGAFDVRIGRVMIKDPTAGAVYVNVRPMSKLTDLSDVTISSPTLDQVLRYNGVEWVNGAPATSSAGPGINFYPDSTTALISKTSENAFALEQLNKYPVTGTSQKVDTIAVTAATSPVMGGAYLYNTALGRTSIDSGSWGFNSYLAVDSVGGGRISSITRQLYKVTPYNSTTVTCTTASGTSSTCTASGGTPFATANIDASATRTTASLLQTTKGLYQISARTNDTEVTIVVPAAYTGDSAVNFKVWKKLFGADSPTITNTVGYGLYTTNSAQGDFNVALTDMLGIVYFGNSNNTTTISYVYNGTTNYSYFSTPLITLHNNLAGLQGGASNEDYHATQLEYRQIQALTAAYDAGLPAYTDRIYNDPACDSSIKLLLYGNGWGSYIEDASPNKKQTTSAGTGTVTQTNAASKYGKRSMYFNGTDYLLIDFPSGQDNDTDFSMGNSDFKIAFYAWPLAVGQGNNSILVAKTKQGPSALAPASYLIFQNSGTNLLTAAYSSNNSEGSLTGYFTSSNAMDGGFNYIETGRSGGEFYISINGVVTKTNIDAGTTPLWDDAGYKIGIGSNGYSSAGFNGYISELQIAKGTAPHTVNFDPPTAPTPCSGVYYYDTDGGRVYLMPGN